MQNELILKIFASFDEFAKKFTDIFSNSDKKQNAEQQLSNLKQCELAANYAADFQFIAKKFNWKNKLLMNFFYVEFKDSIKDKLYKIN